MARVFISDLIDAVGRDPRYPQWEKQVPATAALHVAFHATPVSGLKTQVREPEQILRAAGVELARAAETGCRSANSTCGISVVQLMRRTVIGALQVREPLTLRRWPPAIAILLAVLSAAVVPRTGTVAGPSKPFGLVQPVAACATVGVVARDL